MKSLEKQPDGFVLKQGALFLDGRKVGAVRDNGDFQLTTPDGQRHVGNISLLIRSDVRRQIVGGGKVGPTGRMRVGSEGFDVRAGTVWFAGREVGHLTRAGDYEIEVHGTVHRGNVNRTLGAVWLSGKKGTVSGRIKVGGHSLSALDGVVYEGGEAVGQVTPDGRYRVVTLEGEHLEGRIAVPVAPQLAPRPLTR